MSSEPTKEELRKRFRVVLVVGKYLITERNIDCIKIALGGTTTLTITNPILLRSDIQAGDVITLYTEIPYGH